MVISRNHYQASAQNKRQFVSAFFLRRAEANTHERKEPLPLPSPPTRLALACARLKMKRGFYRPLSS